MKLESATAPQREAITTDHPNVLAVAGPGSGKTATLVARIKHLLELGVRPSELVVLTFTNAAAREIEERLRELYAHDEPISASVSSAYGFTHGPRLGHVGTLHSFCLRLLKEFGGPRGYGERLSIISPESAVDLLVSKATTLGCRVPTKDLLKLKAAGRPARGSRLGVAETVVASYFDDLRDAGIVDFDVLLTEALEMLTWQNGLVPSAERAAGGFSHLFVDEVQDSSPVDWAIYDALPIPNKFFVGDPDQAIYGFRGGSVDLMVARAADSKTHVIKLEDNFRSHAEICAVANNLIERGSRRVKKETISAKGPGGRVLVLEPSLTEGEEIGAVARRIRQLLDLDNTRDLDSSCEGPDWPEIAVLARTNYVAHAFRTTLAATGIPVVGRESLALPKDWNFARSLVELLVNPENDVLAFIFLAALFVKKGASPKEASDAAHAARTAAAAAGKSLNRANIGFSHSKYNTLADVPEIACAYLITAESRMMIADAMKTLPPGASILDLALAMAGTRENVKESAGDGVHVLTIHAAKGREFDVVFLVAFEDELVPGRQTAAVDFAARVEEERRVAYVAVTRARKTLVFSGALSRATRWGTIEPQTPSRFLGEMARPKEVRA